MYYSAMNTYPQLHSKPNNWSQSPADAVSSNLSCPLNLLQVCTALRFGQFEKSNFMLVGGCLVIYVYTPSCHEYTTWHGAGPLKENPLRQQQGLWLSVSYRVMVSGVSVSSSSIILERNYILTDDVSNTKKITQSQQCRSGKKKEKEE